MILKMIKSSSIMCLACASTIATAAVPGWGESPSDGSKDSASAAIEFVAKVPTILTGKWVTFTGTAGGALLPGKFEVQADGQFNTSKPVQLELHYYDPDTATTGDLVDLSDHYGGFMGMGGSRIGKITYTVTKVDFSSDSGTSDVSKAEALVKVNELVIEPGMAKDFTAETNPAVTNWTIANKSAATVFGHIVAGETLSAKATVTADLDFMAR
ncbi:hypothetical protein [Vibrio owensii]|uniref:hypothetical protein n=1 Tax=Vibrio owensii TaxID=696485 RepID=UPI0003AA5C62|nr:hypothetical protein [Vibrio owensii]